jgi:hypothetical protein
VDASSGREESEISEGKGAPLRIVSLFSLFSRCFEDELPTVEQLSPALKSWLDNVIVPALVKEYVSEMKVRDRIDSQPRLEEKSQLMTGPRRERHS